MEAHFSHWIKKKKIRNLISQLQDPDLIVTLYQDGIDISMSTPRRHLKSLGLFRWKAQSDVLDVALFLQEQLNQFKDTNSALVVTQRTVRHLLKILNPQGVQLRRCLYVNPGPNFIWHIDS